jgi:HAD superfamily hydrolase (TIGR01509 family)
MNDNHTPGPFRCIIFDMDGTLTRTNDLIFASFNYISEKYTGKQMTPREIIALFGPPEEGGLAKIVGAQAMPAALDELCEYYEKHHAHLAALHPGIDDLLRYLKERGLRLAVFTGKGNRTAGITLRALGIDSYFDLVISGSDVTHHKPHHEGILRVMDHFGLSAGDVLMVGDAPGDVTASRAAGVKVAAVLWDTYDRERTLAAKADYVFHQVRELSDWFRSHIN